MTPVRLTVVDDAGETASDDVKVAVYVHRFISVSAGWDHTCGLLETGVVKCWGNDDDGRSTPPTVTTFVAVSAGHVYTCGLRETGVVKCWGSNSQGQSTPPTGPFVEVSAGDTHACGLLETGAIACWGSYAYGVEVDADGWLRVSSTAPLAAVVTSAPEPATGQDN